MRQNIRKLYAFNFFASLHLIAGVILPFFTEWGRLSFTQIMILESWFSVCVFLFEIPSGAFADFFGRKRTLSLAIIVNIVGALVYSSYPNFYVFMLGELLWAAAGALISGSEHAILYDTLRKIRSTKESKKIISRYESMGLAGIMVGAPIGSMLASITGVQYAMFYMIAPFTAAFLITLAFKEPRFAKVEKKDYTSILKEGAAYFFKHKTLKTLAVDMVAVSSVTYLIPWFYQKMILSAGLGIEYSGFVFSGIVICEILVMSNFCRLEKLFGSKRRLIFFTSLITGFMLLIGGLTTYLPVVLLVIFLSGGFGMSRPTLFTNYFNKYIPSDKRATVLSSISMTRRIAIAILNPVIGVLVDWSFPSTLLILGAFLILFSFVSNVKEEMLID
jgi:MFS family permease